MNQPQQPWQGQPQPQWPYLQQGYQPPPPPPVGPPTRAKRPWWKAVWFVAIVAGLIGAGIGAGGASASKDKAAPAPTVTATIETTTTPTATVTARPTVVRTIATRTRTKTVRVHPHYDQFGEGLYVVGRELSPGLYHTAGGSDCYWARLASLDTGDIIDNDNTTGPATIEVRASDRALEISGECTFGRA